MEVSNSMAHGVGLAPGYKDEHYKVGSLVQYISAVQVIQNRRAAFIRFFLSFPQLIFIRFFTRYQFFIRWIVHLPTPPK